MGKQGGGGTPASSVKRVGAALRKDDRIGSVDQFKIGAVEFAVAGDDLGVSHKAWMERKDHFEYRV